MHDAKLKRGKDKPEFVSPSTYSFPTPFAAAMSELKVPMLLEMVLWLINEASVPPG